MDNDTHLFCWFPTPDFHAYIFLMGTSLRDALSDNTLKEQPTIEKYVLATPPDKVIHKSGGIIIAPTTKMTPKEVTDHL